MGTGETNDLWEQVRVAGEGLKSRKLTEEKLLGGTGKHRGTELQDCKTENKQKRINPTISPPPQKNPEILTNLWRGG